MSRSQVKQQAADEMAELVRVGMRALRPDSYSVESLVIGVEVVVYDECGAGIWRLVSRPSIVEKNGFAWQAMRRKDSHWLKLDLPQTGDLAAMPLLKDVAALRLAQVLRETAAARALAALNADERI